MKCVRPGHTTLEKFENGGQFHSENRSNVFRSYYPGAISKRNILNLCLKITRTGKSHDLTMSIVFFPHKKEKQAFSNSSGLKSDVEEELRLCDGLVWAVGLAIEIERRGVHVAQGPENT